MSTRTDNVDSCTPTNLGVSTFQPNLEEQVPNPSAKGFYDMLQDADEPLWNGCQNYSKLEAATKLLNWKTKYNISESAYNRALPIMKDMLPDGEKLVGNFYETKKILNKLALPKEKIDACKNHCMLFYKDDYSLTRCRVCGEYRYKKSGRSKIPNLVLTYMPIAPRLQRLYMAKKTAKEMTWYYDRQTEPGKIEHPSDGEAWKHFDSKHPSFAEEIRNVRLGLFIDGFSPNKSNSNSYSSCSVFLTIYNLPPWMGLKEYVKLALVIPGRKSPGQYLDVFLRPLIEELKMLYEEGVVTYDAYRMNNFTMRAVLLWTVSDLHAYAALSGWCTIGKLACPYCMEKTGSFKLQNGGKLCWFDCHRKHLPSRHPFRRDMTGFRAGTVVASRPPRELTGDQIWEQVHHFPTFFEGVPFSIINGFGITHNWFKRSIFWELPYWRTLLIRHNLDIMHIEKSVFENLFNTIMDTSKTKDNMKARKDVETYCDRPELHTFKVNNKVMKPKASYTLTKPQVRKVCEWLKNLKFPDGYASNIKGCVNLDDDGFNSFGSHDYHMFMQRLLPIFLKGMMPNPIWDAITELCTFFRAICSKVLCVDDLVTLQQRIVETICKLEKIFPPSFFGLTEHYVIHLTREAIFSGPVQYRWLHLYERKMSSLEKTVRSTTKIEGSIVESYLVNELSTYCSIHFEPKIEMRLNSEPRKFAPDIASSSGTDSRLSIFKHPSRRLFDKGGKRRAFIDDEMQKAHTYVLLNCEEIHPFVLMFDDIVIQKEPCIEERALNKHRDENFADWFEKYVMQGSDDGTEHLKGLAQGPLRYVRSHKGYVVNGYKFQTLKHGAWGVTHNSGVCVRGSCYNDTEPDYYGLLDDVVEVEYHGIGRCVVVLFKCTWFDIVEGLRVDRKHNLVDIKYKSRIKAEDDDNPFVLASQVEQVYYAPYPSMTDDLKDWWVIVNMKPRGMYEVGERVTEVADDYNMDEEHFFQESEWLHCPTSTGIDGSIEPVSLVRPGEFIEVGDGTYIEEGSDEKEEFEDTDDDSNEDNDDELILSDHSSDGSSIGSCGGPLAN